MFQEPERGYLVQLAAASLAAGATPEEAWQAATHILSRIDAGRPEIEQPSKLETMQTPYLQPRILQISEVFDEEDGTLKGALLENGERRVFLDRHIYLLLDGIAGGDWDYLTIDLVKKYAIYRANGSDSRDYDAIPNYKAYNVVRDLKRIFAHLGIADAIESVKGRGWYFKNLQVNYKDKPDAIFMGRVHIH